MVGAVRGVEAMIAMGRSPTVAVIVKECVAYIHIIFKVKIF